MHDVSQWKDLSLKFVISTWRDVEVISRSKNAMEKKAAEHLAEIALPVCIAVMEKALKWDTDDDGLIENSGRPDQTYDTWSMKGPSSYCNSLWLVALHSLISLARQLEQKEKVQNFQEVLIKAKASFNSKLWNEKGFFVFDTTIKGSDTVMSDQLCGMWYLNLVECLIGDSEIKDDAVFDKDKAKKALQTAYKCNVLGTNGGNIGAANGYRLSLKAVDDSTVQSEEIWTGTSYALASLMITEGLTEEGLNTAKGIYETVYDKCGLAFETPEALYRTKHYRAIGYMRPLACWSVLQALTHKRSEMKS